MAQKLLQTACNEPIQSVQLPLVRNIAHVDRPLSLLKAHGSKKSLFWIHFDHDQNFCDHSSRVFALNNLPETLSKYKALTPSLSLRASKILKPSRATLNSKISTLLNLSTQSPRLNRKAATSNMAGARALGVCHKGLRATGQLRKPKP